MLKVNGIEQIEGLVSTMNNNHNLNFLGVKVTKNPYNHLEHIRPNAIIEDFYIVPLCNKRKYEIFPKDDVVEEQTIIVRSLEPYYEIQLGMVEGNVY
jgi:hypothetical protein